jgi:hypothetical protein
MSAGELEHERAGTPGRMIRERYRRAAEVSKVRGKLSCLMINDIDAGLGHFGNTQVGRRGRAGAARRLSRAAHKRCSRAHCSHAAAPPGSSPCATCSWRLGTARQCPGTTTPLPLPPTPPRPTTPTTPPR